MAKKTKSAKSTDETVVNSVNETENTNNTDIESNTTSTDELTPKEHFDTEIQPELEEVPSAEDTAVEEEEVIEILEEPAFDVIVELSPKEVFEQAISKTPYVIYQNGVMVCHSNPYLSIKTEAKYFEIDFKKYSYAGIEVKHK